MWFAIFFALFLTSLEPVTSSEEPSKQIRILENASTKMPVANTVNLFDLPASTTDFEILQEKLVHRKGKEMRHKYFDFREKSGLLKLRHPVDREAICADIRQCVIRLEIFAVDLHEVLTLDVIIVDVNDNAPSFLVPQIVVNISESAQIGDVILLNDYLAQDSDFGLNGEIIYTISSDQHFFRLQQYKDQSNTSQLRLKLIKKLDYERSPIQRMTLTARDQGNPSLSGEIDLVVRISDVNDNDPVFDQKEYSITKPENLQAGQLLVQVKAKDADLENSGLLRYSLSRHNKKIAHQLLRVDSVTGDVYLKETLDHELHHNLRILIEARDSGLTNQRVGRTWLVLNVEDVNDNFPQIDVKFLLQSRDDNIVFLNENSTIDTYIAYITAKDADFGRNGKTKIKIHSIDTEKAPSPSEKTFILTKNGFLSLNKSVDREKTDKYKIQIQACDFGKPSKCSKRLINVQLLDINDNRPIFSQPIVNMYLPEDTKLFSLLTKLTAFDNDTLNPPVLYSNERDEISPSPYGHVMYHIIDGDGSLKIDPQSGQVVLARPLNREVTERFEITVRAKDGGHKSALQSWCKIYVTVGDVNDNRPVFVHPQFDNISYYATVLRDDVILEVQTVDYDLDENGTVVYQIISEDGVDKLRDGMTSLFLIDFESGELRLNFSNANLNQSLGQHRLVVEARDKGTPPLRNIRVFNVVITNLEKLPEAISVRPSSTSSHFLVIIMTCAVTSFFLVFGILVLVLCKCRHKTTNAPTLTPSTKIYVTDSRSDNLVRIHSHSENKPEDISLTKPVFHPPKEDLVDRRNDSVVDVNHSRLSLASKPSLIQHNHPNSPTHLQPTEYCGPKLLQQAGYYVTLSMRSQDGDSGRGDSDPGGPGSDVIQDNVHQLRTRGTSHPPLGTQCTEQCYVEGHSDACWMPKPDQNSSTSNLSPYGQKLVGSPMYVELSPMPLPGCYQPANGRHFQMSPNHFVGPVWNYPANELSSIYSDVVMTQQKKTCPPYQFNSHLRPVLVENASQRLSPASCISSPTCLPHYNELTKEKNPDSNQRKNSLPRSASVDQLKTSLLSSLNQESSSLPVKNKISSQNLSMKETQDIVDNIEKLLD